MAPSVREVVLEVLGAGGGDDTLLDYLISSMEDEDFEWGADGEAAYEHLGPFIVRMRRPYPTTRHQCMCAERPGQRSFYRCADST